jgi:hypothetical protein
MKLSQLKPNSSNPRRISEAKLQKLKTSIESFEQMMEARPMIVNADMEILGGNMRYRALNALGYDEIPDNWVKQMDFTPEQEREFIIKDNVGFGEWDWDVLDKWNAQELTNWGLEMPTWKDDLFDIDEYNDVNEYDKPAVTDDGYSKFEIIMLHDKKLKFVETLNYIQEKYGIEKQEDAIITLVHKYQENERK